MFTNIKEFFSKMFKKTDDIREFLEDKLADVLAKANESETLDELEKKLIATGIRCGVIYFQSQFGSSFTVTDAQYAQIADVIVEKGINKINPAIVKQLRKK